jgi:hypothetical protein
MRYTDNGVISYTGTSSLQVSEIVQPASSPMTPAQISQMINESMASDFTCCNRTNGAYYERCVGWITSNRGITFDTAWLDTDIAVVSKLLDVSNNKRYFSRSSMSVFASNGISTIRVNIDDHFVKSRNRVNREYHQNTNVYYYGKSTAIPATGWVGPVVSKLHATGSIVINQVNIQIEIPEGDAILKLLASTVKNQYGESILVLM